MASTRTSSHCSEQSAAIRVISGSSSFPFCDVIGRADGLEDERTDRKGKRRTATKTDGRGGRN